MPGMLKTVACRPLPDLDHILSGARDRKLKKYLQAMITIDMLAGALEQGILPHRFDLPNKFVEWLWRNAVDYESGCRDGLRLLETLTITEHLQDIARAILPPFLPEEVEHDWNLDVSLDETAPNNAGLSSSGPRMHS